MKLYLMILVGLISLNAHSDTLKDGTYSAQAHGVLQGYTSNPYRVENVDQKFNLDVSYSVNAGVVSFDRAQFARIIGGFCKLGSLEGNASNVDRWVSSPGSSVQAAVSGEAFSLGTVDYQFIIPMPLLNAGNLTSDSSCSWSANQKLSSGIRGNYNGSLHIHLEFDLSAAL